MLEWMYLHMSINRKGTRLSKAGEPGGQQAEPTDVIALEALATIFRTLGDGTRLQLLRAMTEDCKSVSDLSERSGLPQPLVSHHLRILRDRGLARSQRRGSFVFY